MSEPSAPETALVDFRAEAEPGLLRFVARDFYGPVTVAHCEVPAHGGVTLGSVQTTMVILMSGPVTGAWRPITSQRLLSGNLNPGEVMLFPANQLVWQRWEDDAEVFVVALEEVMLNTAVQQLFEDNVVLELAPQTAVRDPILTTLGGLLQLETIAESSGGRLYVESLGSALASHLVQHYGNTAPRGGRASERLSPVQLRRVIEHINQNLHGELSLAELAAVANISPYHFAHGFKQTVGIPPHRYVVERRIEQAKQLLLETAQPIADIALEAGFSSQSHMTTVFRRVLGVTPKVYRDSHGRIDRSLLETGPITGLR